MHSGGSCVKHQIHDSFSDIMQIGYLNENYTVCCQEGLTISDGNIW